MQLSPLQSRLAASFLATFLLIVLYLFLFSPHFALAAELNLRSPIVLDDIDVFSDPKRSVFDPVYEPEFAPFPRSLIGRAPPGVTALVNNVPEPMNVNPGSTQCFVFESSQIFGRWLNPSGLELRGEQTGSQEDSAEVEARDVEDRGVGDETVVKRQSAKEVFISANTCMQPQPNSSASSLLAPQLTLYISTSSDNTCPGPGRPGTSQIAIPFTEGAVIFNTSASSDVYIGISAPNVTSQFTGGYNFQVAASTDAYFFSYDDQPNSDLIWVDSDPSSALLITRNLTNSLDPTVDQQVMSTEPYVMFAQPDSDPSINGLQYSYCGLQNYARIAGTKNGQFTSMVTTSMTRMGPGDLPKQQFYFSGLNASTSYLGILALTGNSTQSGSGVAGGGTLVYRATNFTTKSAGGNCAVIFNLTFCDQVAYAVPSNNNSFPNTSALASFYDSNAQSQYLFFQNILQQIPCEAPPEQQYSLVRTCDDCAAAYKAWLCSVTIPRCEDFSNNSSFLQPRAVFSSFPDNTTLPASVTAAYPNISAFNSSRNPLIDQQVQPGPYKEVLPCQDVCFNLVQSCPAAMGFACPRPWQPGYNYSYGVRTSADDDGTITCNYPGSAHFFSAAGRRWITPALLAVVPTLLALALI